MCDSIISDDKHINRINIITKTVKNSCVILYADIEQPKSV